MTLDEAIRHAERVVTFCEVQASGRDPHSPKFESNIVRNLMKCAEMHKQLAEWLKELKQLKEQEPCEDAVSRSDVIALIRNTNYKHLFYVARGISQKAFEDLLNGTQALPHVKPVACIAEVKFNKEDMQKIVDEKMKELKVMAGDIVTCKDCKYNTKNGKFTAVCDMGHRFRMREPSTFYCADAEMREK
jgi:hypothetical protein